MGLSSEEAVLEEPKEITYYAEFSRGSTEITSSECFVKVLQKIKDMAHARGVEVLVVYRDLSSETDLKVIPKAILAPGVMYEDLEAIERYQDAAIPSPPVDKYTRIIFWSEEDGDFIGRIPEIKNVMVFGETREECMIGLDDAIKLILKEKSDIRPAKNTKFAPIESERELREYLKSDSW